MAQPFEKRNSSGGEKNSILKGNFAKGISNSPDSVTRPTINHEKKHMTERERLQASLKATLTEFKQ